MRLYPRIGCFRLKPSSLIGGVGATLGVGGSAMARCSSSQRDWHSLQNSPRLAGLRQSGSTQVVVYSSDSQKARSSSSGISRSLASSGKFKASASSCEREGLFSSKHSTLVTK